MLPKPGFPYYEAISAYVGLETRYFDLLPEQGWEVDLDAVESLADENTVAIVVINPGNPCGNVYSYKHLQKVCISKSKFSSCLMKLSSTLSLTAIIKHLSYL